MATKDIFEQDPQKYMSGGISDMFALPRAAAGWLGNKAHRAFGVDDPYATNPYIENIKTGIGSPEGSTRLGIPTSSGVAPLISFGSGKTANKVKASYTPKPTATQTIQPAPAVKTFKPTTKALPQSQAKVATQPQVASTQAPALEALLTAPDTNYGSVIDENGVERRIYTPQMGVKPGYYDSGNGEVFNVDQFTPNVSTVGTGETPASALGRSAYFAQQEATPGSQKEWEQNQANNQALESLTKKYMDAGLSEATAAVAANNIINKNKEVAIKEGELGIKQGDAPFERGYKAALTGNALFANKKGEALLPTEVNQAKATLEQTGAATEGTKATTERTRGVEKREQELFPLTKREVEATIGQKISEVEYKKLMGRAAVLRANQGGTGNTGLNEQNKVVQAWYKMAGEADAIGNKEAADKYRTLGDQAGALPSLHFANKVTRNSSEED